VSVRIDRRLEGPVVGRAGILRQPRLASLGNGVVATYFVNHDLTAVAKALAAVRDDVVYPGYGLHGVEPEALDRAWLPIVGQLGLGVITKDKHIRYRPAETRHCSRTASERPASAPPSRQRDGDGLSGPLSSSSVSLQALDHLLSMPPLVTAGFRVPQRLP